jgi:hypothetical protein
VRNPAPRIAIALALAAGCAPQIDGPVDHQRAIDRDDGDRLGTQLAQLPGVVTASVVLHRAMRDPLAVAPPRPATLTAVISIDDRADRGAIHEAAARLTHAAVPELSSGAASIEVHATVHRPTVTKVGPFSVEDSSRDALKATLALGCLAIAGLAVAIALLTRRHRLGNSAQ